MNVIVGLGDNRKLEISKDDKKIIREYKGQSLVDFPNSYVVLDIETTGLDPRYDSIIEIGAIKYINGEESGFFSQLVKPDSHYILNDDDINDTTDYCIIDGQAVQYVDRYITDLTGITNKMLENACCEGEVLNSFGEFIQDLTIVGHNVNFDINFLYDAYMANLKVPLKNNFIDTMRLARIILKELKHHRLRDLAEYYKISYEGAHRSLKDCYITYGIFKELKNAVIMKHNDIASFIEFYKQKSCSSTSVKNITTSKTEFDEEHPLYGKVCVFTGTLERMPRKDAMQIVVDLGGVNGNSVTAKTNYLILGNNDYCSLIKDGKSSKQKKAEGLKLKGKDIEVISENVFYDMLEQ